MSTQLQSSCLKTNQTALITVTLSADDMKLLNRLAEIKDSTKKRLAKKFIVESAEDMADVMIADDAMRKIRLGEERLYTEEEARVELGLDD